MTDRPNTTTQQDTRDVARQEKEQVKGTARDAASKVGDTAAQRGQELKGQAKGHARDLARNAQRQLRGHAQEETQRAGSALSTAGDQLRALAEGRVEDAGVLGDYVEQAADAVTRWADTINDRGFDGLLDDLRSAGRRRPGLFLGGALLAGVLAGRFGRNVAQELGDDDQSALPGDTGTTSAGGTGGDGYGATDEPVGGGTGGTGGVATSAAGTGAPPATAPRGVDDVRPTERAADADRGRSDDMIVGYASDDQGVVVDPAGRTADDVAPERPVAAPDEVADDDLEYRPIDADQGRRR